MKKRLFLAAGVLALFLTACSSKISVKTSVCDSIQNKSLKSDCKSASDSSKRNQLLFNDVLLTFDSSRCSTIPVDYLKQGCFIALQKTGVKGPISTADQAILQKAFSANDLFACRGFKAKGLDKYCIQTVANEIQKSVYKRIIQIGDVKNCENLKNQKFKKACFAELGPAKD